MIKEPADARIFLFNAKGHILFPVELMGSTVADLPPPYPQAFAIGLELTAETPENASRKSGDVRVDKLRFGREDAIACVRETAPGLEKELDALRARNRELEVIMESSIDGFAITDGEGRFVRVNSSYAQIAGEPAERLVGKTVYELAEEGIFSPSATELALERKRPITINQFFRNGTRQTLNTSNPVFNEDGSLYRVVTNVRDMSEVHSLRAELEESRALIDHYAHLLENMTRQQTIEGYHASNNSSMQALYFRALEYASVSAPVLIFGESGVGKELVADFIHGNSPRKDKPFLKINCGAVPEQLLEAELFGYEGGAFTGARKQGRTGLFEVADGGTVFLDEVGEMPLSVQVKLLRFVQNREFYRLGGNRLYTVDVRLIAATNRNLDSMVAERAFRTDLFYRLNVLPLHVPPLRDRPEDIIPLANHFLQKFNTQYAQEKFLSPAVCDLFESYPWPGNVRELANLLERLAIIRTGGTITPAHLPEQMRKKGGSAPFKEYGAYRETLEAFEREYWSAVLKKYKSYRQAAEDLGVNHSTIVKKVARYKIEPPMGESR